MEFEKVEAQDQLTSPSYGWSSRGQQVGFESGARGHEEPDPDVLYRHGLAASVHAVASQSSWLEVDTTVRGSAKICLAVSVNGRSNNLGCS
eukprot:3002555-Rhodomonas_salina.1